MSIDSPDERHILSTRIQQLKRGIAEAAVRSLFQAIPQWQTRCASAGVSVADDIAHHMNFLASAVEGDTIASFEHYVRWTIRVLKTRQLPAELLADTLEHIRLALNRMLPGSQSDMVNGILYAGIAIARQPQKRGGRARTVDDLSPNRDRLLEYLISGDKRRACDLSLTVLSASGDLVTLYDKLVDPVIRRIEQMQSAGEITIAHEHVAENTLSHVISHLRNKRGTPKLIRGMGVVASLEGNHHQMAAETVADVLEADGWDVRFLGSQVPWEAMVDYVNRYRPDFVGLCAVCGADLDGAAALIRVLRTDRVPCKPMILASGEAFAGREARQLAGGADGVAATVAEAVSLLRLWDERARQSESA